MCVSASICASCAFSLALFSLSEFVYFVLFWFVLVVLLFSNERKKKGCEQRQGREVGGGETVNRIYCINKTIFN